MQLRTFMKLSGELSIDQMLDKLKAVADPRELDELAASTISRHASGKMFPSARLQELYALATDRAVMPNDWVELAREARQAKQEGEAING
jgi:hypothetical protein